MYDPDFALNHGWRVSPLATAVRLSAYEREPYIPAKHLKLISDTIVDSVESASHGKYKFVIIEMPPRHGKSWEVSRYTPPWFLGNWPHKHVMICGYGAQFAKQWGRLTRNDAVKNASLLGWEVAQDSSASEQWHTSEGGSLCTAGIGGSITGKGADLMVIDDPIKNSEEAFSITYRDKLWKWWMTTARTRLHPGGTIVVVMTRWHTDDFVGRLLNPEFSDPAQFIEVRLPAIWEGDEPDAIGRRKGQALWPARYDEKYFESLRKTIDEETWMSLYQQTPINILGLGNVYYGFDEKLNVIDVERDPRLPLIWSLDFNVNPMSSIVAQHREQMTYRTMLTNEVLVSAEVLDEISLPYSNTPQACREFHDRVMKRGWYMGIPIELHVHGDVSGNHATTSGSPSDWEIVKRFFAGRPEYRVTYDIGKDNPAVKDRTNAVCAALKAADGTRRLFVDRRCKELIKDLNEVVWKKDSSGTITGLIDKRDPKRTHLSDALGYYIHKRFKLAGQAGYKPNGF